MLVGAGATVGAGVGALHAPTNINKNTKMHTRLRIQSSSSGSQLEISRAGAAIPPANIMLHSAGDGKRGY
jgi:hypothetical protein